MSWVPLSVHSANSWVGQPITRLVDALKKSGIGVIYSSQFLPPELLVPLTTTGSSDLETLRSALALQRLRLVRISDRLYSVQAIGPASTHASAAVQQLPARSAGSSDASGVPEVTVSASRYILTSGKAGGPTVFDERSVARVPGTTNDVLRATETLPGMAISEAARPHIRGAQQDEVLLLYDGVVIDEPFHLANFQSLLSAFDPAVVDRIEVFSGGIPARYGTRSGGVVSMTPRATAEAAHLDVSAGLSAFKASASGTGREGRLEWLAAVRRTVPNVVVEPAGGLDQPVVVDLLSRVRWAPNESLALIAGLLSLDDRIRVANEQIDSLATARYRDTHAWLTLDARPGESWEGSTSFSALHSERDRHGHVNSPLVSLGSVDERRDLDRLSLTTRWIQRPTSGSQWEIGAELSRSTGTGDYRSKLEFSPAVAHAFGKSLMQGISARSNFADTRFALYTSNRFDAFGRLVTTVGVRVDGQQTDGSSAHELQWSPRILSAYRVTPDLDTYASWGMYSQRQRLDELRLEAAQQNLDSAQVVTQEILGANFRLSDASSWRIEMYRKNWHHVSPFFDNLLGVRTPFAELLPDRILVTPKSAKAAGIEISTRGNALSQRLHYWGSASLSYANDVMPEKATPKSWDQRIALSAGGSWDSGHLTLAGAVKYHSGWPRTPFTLASLPSGFTSRPLADLRNSRRWPDYFSVDLRILWNQPFGFESVQLYADLTNATNRGNPCCTPLETVLSSNSTGSAAANWTGRTIDLGITWHVPVR